MGEQDAHTRPGRRLRKRAARGSLRELETQSIIAAHLHYITKEIEKEMLQTIDDIGRMLHGLISFAKEPS